jgi:hypothetical protein
MQPMRSIAYGASPSCGLEGWLQLLGQQQQCAADTCCAAALQQPWHVSAAVVRLESPEVVLTSVLLRLLLCNRLPVTSW